MIPPEAVASHQAEGGLGYCKGGIFYISSKNEKAKLLKMFYHLLNCKVEARQSRFAQESRERVSLDRNAKETYKPAINKTLRPKSRSGLKNHHSYSAVLHKRSEEKEMKREKIRTDNLRREMNECSFTPLTNV